MRLFQRHMHPGLCCKILLSITMAISLTTVPLNARSIEATGFGNTKAEAMKDAETALLNHLYGEYVTSVSRASMSYQNGNESEDWSLDQTSISKGRLIAVEFENETLESDGLWSVNAVIRDSAIDSYILKLDNLSASIEGLYSSEKYGSRSSDSLLLLYEYLKEWEDYAIVVTAMGYSERIPALAYQLNSDSLLSEWQDQLIEEANRLEEKEKTTEDRNELDALLRELERNRNEYARIEDQKRQEALANESISRKILEEKLASLRLESRKPDIEEKAESPVESVISNIEKQLALISESFSEFNALVSDTFAGIDKDFTRTKQEILDRNYRTAEIDTTTGKPVASAEKAKMAEIDKHQLRAEILKMQLLKTTAESFRPVISNQIAELKKMLSEPMEDMAVQHIASERSSIIITYDPERKGWLFHFNVWERGLNNTPFQFFVSYEDITGKDAIGPDDDRYREYLDDIDFYDEIFSNIHSYADIDLKFSMNLEVEGDTAFVRMSRFHFDIDIPALPLHIARQANVDEISYPFSLDMNIPGYAAWLSDNLGGEV